MTRDSSAEQVIEKSSGKQCAPCGESRLEEVLSACNLNPTMSRLESSGSKLKGAGTLGFFLVMRCVFSRHFVNAFPSFLLRNIHIVHVGGGGGGCMLLPSSSYIL